MAWIGNYIYNTIFSVARADDTQQDDETPDFCSSDRYQPSVSDVIAIKEALHKKSTLPYELVDTIVDMAEYWPHTTTATWEETRVRAGNNHENVFILRSYPLGYLPPTRVTNNILHEEYDMHLQYGQCYETLQPKPWPESRHFPAEATEEVLSKWTSKSLPKGETPCRKIVFTIKSHDQGWGGAFNQRGTYVGSYTWFDVGLERMTATREDIVQEKPELAPQPQFNLHFEPPQDASQQTPVICNLRTVIPATPVKRNETDPDSFEHPLLPSMTTLQKNITASRDTKEHKITWLSSDNVIPDSLDAAELEKQGRGRDTANGEFVRNLKVGDVVTVWAKARFPQWINFVEEVRMDVYWAV